MYNKIPENIQQLISIYGNDRRYVGIRTLAELIYFHHYMRNPSFIKEKKSASLRLKLLKFILL